VSDQGADQGAVLGGFENLKVDDVPHDVLILRAGLLLLAHQELSGSHVRRLKRLLAEVPVEELVRRHRLVRFRDVAQAKIVKRTPVRVELEMAGGRRMTMATGWTTPTLTKDSEKVLVDLLTEQRDVRPLSEDAAAEAGRAWSENVVVLDAMANVVVNDVAYDLVVLDVGLVLISDPGRFEQGEARLKRLVETMPAYEIVGRNRLVRYEEVIDARITKDIPLHAEIEMYRGPHLVIRERMVGQSLTRISRSVLVDALRSVGARTP
jgi:hypothetical protein